MTRDRLIELTQCAHQEWEALITTMADRLDEPVSPGDWTVKDLVGHIAWYEREMVNVTSSHALVGSPLWNLPLDERNARIREEFHDRPADQVLADERRIYGEMIAALQALDDADMDDPRRFADMPQEWLPWEMIASNTYEHYHEHISQLKAWLKQA